jgi:hypothetical protein
VKQIDPAASAACAARVRGVVVSVSTPHELAFWAKLFEVEPAVLLIVVRTVGTGLAAIERELRDD